MTLLLAKTNFKSIKKNTKIQTFDNLDSNKKYSRHVKKQQIVTHKQEKNQPIEIAEITDKNLNIVLLIKLLNIKNMLVDLKENINMISK